MRSFFELCLNILTFGILPLIKWLVKLRTKGRTDKINIDLNRDGKIDIIIDLDPDHSDPDDITNNK